MQKIKAPKKPIEAALPLADIDREAARAVLFAQMVSGPSHYKWRVPLW